MYSWFIYLNIIKGNWIWKERTRSQACGRGEKETRGEAFPRIIWRRVSKANGATKNDRRTSPKGERVGWP